MMSIRIEEREREGEGEKRERKRNKRKMKASVGNGGNRGSESGRRSFGEKGREGCGGSVKWRM